MTTTISGTMVGAVGEPVTCIMHIFKDDGNYIGQTLVTAGAFSQGGFDESWTVNLYVETFTPVNAYPSQWIRVDPFDGASDAVDIPLATDQVIHLAIIDVAGQHFGILGPPQVDFPTARELGPLGTLLPYLAKVLEPNDQVDLDETYAEPFDWEPNRLYTYLMPQMIQEQFETGPTALQRFVARIVFVTDDQGEAADRRRNADLTALLDTKRDSYLTTLRERMSSPPYWDFAQASEVPPPATLQSRAVSLQLTGYRIVS
jgi:hypothetical protein